MVRMAAQGALEKNAEELVTAIRSLVPVDQGDLRDSIGWTWGDGPAGSLTIASFGGREYGAMRVTVYAGSADAFYAAFVEFGTQANEAHPFFFPAYRALRPRFRRRITRVINKAIKQAASA